jgi:hypothetical protein
MRIDRNADHFDIALPEFVQPVIESDQFGRADKCEVQRPEKHDCIFSGDMLFQIERFVEVVVAHHRNSVEIGGGFADEYSHDLLLG